MKLNFTQITLSVLAVFGLVSANAQTFNTLTVESGGNSIEIEFGIASYGLTEGAAVSGQLVVADDGMESDINGDGVVGTAADGCDAFTTDVTGSVALVDRGECPFGLKSDNAEAAGAIALIICNHPNGFPDPTMIDEDQFISPIPGDNGEGEMTTIPSVGISINSCAEIKMLLAADDVTVTLSYVQPDGILWAEDFGDGLPADWRVFKGTNTEITGPTLEDGTWIYETDPDIDRGSFGGLSMASPTASNGYMTFESDFYDTAGLIDPTTPSSTWVFGQGVCPSNMAGQFCEGLLQSPVIDLTQFTPDGLALEFHQHLRDNASEYFIYLSRDGGATWEDQIQINLDVAVNTETVNSVYSQSLCGYEDATEFTFAIFYRGGFYFWAVDDVVIRNTGASNVDLGISQNWYSGALQFRTPASQADVVPFLMDVNNFGPGDATNVAVDVDVRNLTTLTTAYTATNQYPDLGCGVLDENRPFPELFNVPNEEARYEITYTISSDNPDADNTNNQRSLNFEVGGNVFQRTIPESELGSEYLSAIRAPGAYYGSFGNAYYMPNGAGYKATTVRFGVLSEDGGVPENGQIQAVLYRWVDLDNDGVCEGDERITVGQTPNVIIGPNTGIADHRNLELELQHPSDPSLDILLEDNAQYVAMVHLKPLNDLGVQWGWLANNASASGTYSFGAANFAFQCPYGNPGGPQDMDANGNMICDFGEGLYTDEDGLPIYRFTSMSGTGVQDDEDVREFTTGVAGAWTAFMDLNIVDLLDSGTEDLNNALNIEIYPNPVAEKMFVDLALNAVSANVAIDLMDTKGQRVHSSQYKNVLNQTIEIDVNAFPSGIYHLNIRTEEGFTSKKIVIQND